MPRAPCPTRIVSPDQLIPYGFSAGHKRVRQDLQRDITTQSSVARAKHLAHAAFTDLGATSNTPRREPGVRINGSAVNYTGKELPV